MNNNTSEKAMRKIITGNVDGRARVVVDDNIPQDDLLAIIWNTSPDAPLGNPPAPIENTVPSLQRGHASWRVVTVPPDAVMREWLAKGVPGLDERGFHTTDTIDYVVVLDGPVTLALDDDEEVDLQPGDVVVQRQTHHAWFNRNDYPIRLLCLLVGI